VVDCVALVCAVATCVTIDLPSLELGCPFQNVIDSIPLLLTIVTPRFPGDFLRQDAGERCGLTATELRAFASVRRDHMQEVITVNTPHAISMVGSQSEPTYYFAVCHLEISIFGVIKFATEIFVSAGRRGEAKHHERITCRAHKIVPLLDHLAVLAMIESELLPPVIM
jgi:hypothetical protein